MINCELKIILFDDKFKKSTFVKWEASFFSDM